MIKIMEISQQEMEIVILYQKMIALCSPFFIFYSTKIFCIRKVTVGPSSKLVAKLVIVKPVITYKRCAFYNTKSFISWATALTTIAN